MSITDKPEQPVGHVALHLPKIADAFHKLIITQFPSGSVIRIEPSPPENGRYHIEIWDDHTLLYYVQPDGMTYIAKAFFDGRVGFYGDSEAACEQRAVTVYKGALEYYRLLSLKGPLDS